jgi:hypothetical protein
MKGQLRFGAQQSLEFGAVELVTQWEDRWEVAIGRAEDMAPMNLFVGR